MCFWIYPLIVHWTWGGGWLTTVYKDHPFIDQAGGSIVHVTGGVSGLIGAIIVGPRFGRFD